MKFMRAVTCGYAFLFLTFLPSRMDPLIAAETDPKADYHLWLMLPPADGQYWEDDKYRASVRGPFEVDVPYGEFGDVYRVRYDYVEEAGHYEVWWYAPGVGCILYEHYLPEDKHELVELVEFSLPK